MLKAYLAPKIRNVFDESRFLALEAFSFSVLIYFLDFVIF